MMPTASRHCGCWKPLFPRGKSAEANRKILSPNDIQATRNGHRNPRFFESTATFTTGKQPSARTCIDWTTSPESTSTMIIMGFPTVDVGGTNRRVLNRSLYTNYIALPIPLWWPSKSWISVDILDKPGHNLHRRLNFIVSVRTELVLRHQTDTTAIQPKKESIAAQEGINSSIHQSWPRPALVPTAGEHDGYHIAMVTPC